MIYQFPYEWSKVTQANWLKYPNSSSSHVIHVDVLSREVTDCGILRTERVIACRQPIPEWIKRILNIGPVAYFREVSEVDLKKRTFTAITKNLTFSSTLIVEEKIEYSSNADDSKITVLEQDFKITALGCYPRLKAMLEDICMQRFISNAEKGRQGLEEVIRRSHIISDHEFSASTTSATHSTL